MHALSQRELKFETKYLTQSFITATTDKKEDEYLTGTSV
jgi:hypothetical protein